MTTTKSWIAAGTIMVAALLASFILLGDQRPAHAQSAGTIVNGVFCFLNQFPTTNVFSGTPCAPVAAASSTLTVIKTVTGTSTPSGDFNIEVMGTNGIIANDPGSSSGTTYLGVDPGTYTISETVNATGQGAGVSLSDYTATFSGDCNSSGSITLTVGTSSGCTITNTYKAPAPKTGVLEIIKTISGGNARPSEFSFAVNGAATTTFNVSGTNDIVEPEGVYTVAEVATSTYTSSYHNNENADADCNGIEIVAGATTTCSITNTFINSNNGGGGGKPTSVVQTIIVKPENLTTSPFSNNWFFYNDQSNTLDNTLGTFVLGPATAPLGIGSAQVGATTTQGIFLATLANKGLPLSDITTLSYSTYRSVGDPALALALQFDINPDSSIATSSYDGRLVYEPYYTHTVSTGTWQTWNTMDNTVSGGHGNWWFSKGWIATKTGCSQTTPCTWSQILAALPHIGVSGSTGFKAGSNWSSSFTGNVDDLVLATSNGTSATTTTYDFEPDVSDIGITKTVSSATPNLGDTVTYTITASDTGADATGVVVKDLLPSGLTFVSTSTNDMTGIYDPVNGNWTIGALSSTTPATLHIVATITGGQSNGTMIANTATTTAGDTSSDSVNNVASASITVTIPNNTPNNPAGGGGGGGGGGNGPIPGSIGGRPVGQVLGASTSTVPLVPCSQYLSSFIKLGGDNDEGQVTRLQEFLDQFEGAKLTINGTYDQATYEAVKTFQQKYASDVLTPWGESTSTGFVYLTTRREVNLIYCNYRSQFPLTSSERAEIQAYKDEAKNETMSGNQDKTQMQTTMKIDAITPTDTSKQDSNERQNASGKQPNTSGINEVGVAGMTQSDNWIWGSIAQFFEHLFGR